jgi:hypothetical protein
MLWNTGRLTSSKLGCSRLYNIIAESYRAVLVARSAGVLLMCIF